MKPYLFIISLLLCIFSLSGCKNNPSENTGSQNPDLAKGDSLLEGEQKVFYDNGKIHYIVEYKKGKANGRVQEYSTDGKLYMDAVYVDGHRHGKCTHFYKNGKPFEVSNYVNGEKEGIETKYYESGAVLATRIYKKNKVQPGLKEFEKDGREIVNTNSIVVRGIDHTLLEGKYILQVSLAQPQKNVTFYAAPRSDPESRQKLKVSGASGILEIPVSSSNFVMKSLLFEAEYKTRLGNIMVLQKTFNLAVDK
jgi:hypothetical protein